MQTYTVKPGDSLSKISQQFYGSGSEYMKIFEANRDQLSDPNKIKAGQVLKDSLLERSAEARLESDVQRGRSRRCW